MWQICAADTRLFFLFLNDEVSAAEVSKMKEQNVSTRVFEILGRCCFVEKCLINLPHSCKSVFSALLLAVIPSTGGATPQGPFESTPTTGASPSSGLWTGRRRPGTTSTLKPKKQVAGFLLVWHFFVVCSITAPSPVSVSSAAQGRLSSSAKVFIKVLDINDNVPRLARDYQPYICEGAQPGDVCILYDLLQNNRLTVTQAMMRLL